MTFRRSSSWATIALAVVIVEAARGVSSPTKDDAGVSVNVERAISAEVEKGFSGAVLVARGERPLLEKGYGSVGGVAMGGETKFWIASAGKQFTSAAVLLCAQEGKLTLEDPIARFFPEARKEIRSVTIRQLLSHTSGFDQSDAGEGAADRSTAVSRMLREPLIDPPGRKFHYSNSNYQLAVAIVEIVSHEPYREIARSMWKKAGLTRTGFSGDGGASDVAPASSPIPERLRKPGWGGEGVYSTVGDLFAWYRALRSGRVVPPSSAELLFSPVAPIGEGRTALGWFLGRTSGGVASVFTRGNEDFGANSLLYAYPDSGIVVVVLTHAGDASEDLSWSRSVLRKIEDALGLAAPPPS